MLMMIAITMMITLMPMMLMMAMTIEVREGLAVAAAEGVDIPAEEADHIFQKVLVMIMMKLIPQLDSREI